MKARSEDLAFAFLANVEHLVVLDLLLSFYNVCSLTSHIIFADRVLL